MGACTVCFLNNGISPADVQYIMRHWLGFHGGVLGEIYIFLAVTFLAWCMLFVWILRVPLLALAA